MHNSGDPWGIVGAVRFKLTASQRLFKGHLPVHALVDRIRLVTIGHNRLVSQNPDRCIDDQAGVRKL